MKKGRVLVVALALLALVAGTAQAEMYVEGYLGGNFAGNASASPDISMYAPGIILFPGTYPGNIDPAFQGGLKLGAWFERSGVLSGINFPAWMKYLGFYVDFSYHRVDFPERRAGAGIALPIYPFIYNAKSEGAAATLAFMFAARYGFMPDKDVPFGRLQAYAAVGPAVMFTWQQPTVKVIPGFPGGPFVAGPIAFKPDSDHCNTIALAVEAGLRWMCLKNVSLDVSFKYRYAHPVYNFSYGNPGLGLGPFTHSFRYSAPFNFYSVQVGAAYHF